MAKKETAPAVNATAPAAPMNPLAALLGMLANPQGAESLAALLAKPQQPLVPVVDVDTVDGLTDQAVRAWKSATDAKAAATEAAKVEYGWLRKLAGGFTDKLGAGWWRADSEAGKDALAMVLEKFKAAGHANPSVVKSRLITYGIAAFNAAERKAAEKAGREPVLEVDPNADKRTPIQKAQDQLASLWLTLEGIETPAADVVKLKDAIRKLTTKAAIEAAEKKRKAKDAKAAPKAPPALM